MKKLSFTKILIFFIYFLFSKNLYAQYTLMGQDPHSIRWNQIKTDKFVLVYDSKYENQAQRLAALLDYALPLTGNSLNQSHKKVKILLHNHMAIPNGFVTLAPSRMEFYTTPPQDMFGQEWLEQLALHEGRHWAQLNRIKSKNAKILSYIFGDIGWGLAVAQTHLWFLEGDAVVTETALSHTGRGRLPSFEMGFRTIQLTLSHPYPFRKSVFGAYDDYVPNHYELGYLMVAYNRLKYGTKFWENVLEEIGKNPIPAPFYFGIKKQTGLNREQLYKKTFYELDSLWRQKISHLNFTPYTPLTSYPKTSYTSLRSPKIFENKIIALRSGLDYPLQVVIIDPITKQEKVLFSTGNMPSNRITISNGLIYFDEFNAHVRWGNKVYSVIKAYDIKRERFFNITHETRYFAPAASPKGNYLAVVENDIAGQNYICLLHPLSGDLLIRYPSPANAAIQLPSWSSDEKKIVCTLVDTGGKKIAWLNLNDSSWHVVHSTKNYDLSYPIFSQKYIIFNATYSGIDNIFALDTATNEIYQLTSVSFGAFDPCVDTLQQKLVFANYGYLGYDLVSTPFHQLAWKPLSEVNDVSLQLADKLAKQEPIPFIRDSIHIKKYLSTPYRKWLHGINVHSWLPFYLHSPKNKLTTLKLFPGYQIMSQNLLGTLSFVGGQGYYQKNLYNSLEMTYSGLFPVLQMGIQQGDTLGYINLNQNIRHKKTLNFYSDVSLPFNLSDGSAIITFQPGITYEYSNSQYSIGNGQVKEGQYNLYYYAILRGYKRMAPRDFVPRWGLLCNINYANPIRSSKTFFSSQITAQTRLFFPGLFPHHAFNLTWGYENQNLKYYLSSSRLDPPRGYVVLWDSIKPYMKSVNQISIDYYFPLSYKANTFLKIIYVKLLAGSVFISSAITEEYQRETYKFLKKDYSSFGYQLFSDLHLFFLPITFRLGYNYSYQIKNERFVIEPYLRMNYSF